MPLIFDAFPAESVSVTALLISDMSIKVMIFPQPLKELESDMQ